MTYIVYDGKHVIADRLCQTNIGKDIPGRAEPKKGGSYPLNGSATNTTIYFDDVKKLYTGDYKFRDTPIKVIAIAGSTRNFVDMLGALEQGVDLDVYVTVDVNIQPKVERRIFNGETTVFTLLENGAGVVLRDSGDGINISESKKFIHLGSGTDIVDSLWEVIPGEKGVPKFTALEAFVLASSHCTTVGRVFDYYCVKTGEIFYNNKLTEKQITHILTKLQKRIDLTSFYDERVFVNRG